jgi:hypothetical protein
MSNSSSNKKSVNLLPSYFQTPKNSKFLSSTIDQLYKTPSLTRINGFVGSKYGPTYNSLTDVYLKSTGSETDLRNKYQFQPAVIVNDSNDLPKNAYAFDDLVNQLSFYNVPVNNLDRLFSPDINSYDPHIDWDKFVNFREYYWLPMGPDSITVSGLQRNTVSSYTVTDSKDGNYFVFTPDGATENPVLTLYKGVTYIFNINSKHTFYIKTSNESGSSGSLTGNGVSNGQVIFTVSDTLPGILYYVSDDINVVPGTILVRDIVENSSLNVEEEIIGKSYYKTASGVEFINGLKITFAGEITPSTYLNKEFIVEGVGKAIKLVDFAELQTPENLATQYDSNFDATAFDDFPFDNFKNLPITPEYVTINRSSRDLNPWSRYNRWFHSDVIKTSASANGVVPVLPINKRASRPIIEFEADLQLYNFGSNSIDPVDIIDQTTTDVFSLVEGSVTYRSDGVNLQPGQTIIFTADPDPLVAGKVFKISLALINGVYKIALVDHVIPVFGNSVVITSGTVGQGTEWWFDGKSWVKSQQRTTLNQAPLFDLFDQNGNSYSDKNYYDSIFFGNKLFGYSVGTGVNDPVLGFPLNYKNVGVEGSYLFENYFNNETLSLLSVTSVTVVPTSTTFLRINNNDSTFSYVNVWTKGEYYQIPVQQFQVIAPNTTTIPITVYDLSGTVPDLIVEVFKNSVKLKLNVDYTLSINSITQNLEVNFVNAITDTSNVLIKCYSTFNSPNSTGVYEIPLNLTNNPLNGVISQFTLSELSDHVQTMISRAPNFTGVFPGVSNLKNLPNITKYGTRLITSNNPISFAQLFITDVKNSLVNAIRSSAVDYYQFKLNLMKFISESDGNLPPKEVLDQAISETIKNKSSSFPYGHSDMIAYGNNYTTKTYTVTDVRNVIYPLNSIFDIAKLSNRSVLIYLNGNILIEGKDYTFNSQNPNVQILTPLQKGDTVTINDYVSTVGSYTPPTPTKLGLYPKYEPMLLQDKTYANDPVIVLQGHDGSLTVAYTSRADWVVGNIDFRDLAMLEFEKRIFNNLKASYNPDIMNISKLTPGAFRVTEFEYSEILKLIEVDFIKWTNTYGIDSFTNNSYDINNYKTYNYKSAYDYFLSKPIIAGHWRGISKYYFDTDRPNTHPWEMLGFSIKPQWWESEYGPAPYTSGNLNLWQDLEKGLIKQGERAGIDLNYARPGLSTIIPVDENGNVIDIRNLKILSGNDYIPSPDQNWVFGDYSPSENAWRRSSLWPFAVQLMMALTKPADYSSKMFDPSKLEKDLTGQYRYGSLSLFLNPSTINLYSDTDSSGNSVLTSGYNAWVIENGRKRTSSYLTNLKQDLSNLNVNLFYKAGGFLSKDKLEIIIDSVSPNTTSPGVLLPNEDYSIFFNVSNPTKSVSISGIVVEKRDGKFIIKGYDKEKPFFYINAPLHRNNDSVVTVGGKSSPYLLWAENTFYQTGQIVKYNNTFYTVLAGHNSGTTFNKVNYIKLSQLPVVGGASALSTLQYSSDITVVPYGTQYTTLQEVYDVIVGYGKFLVNQGFIFNGYNSDLGVVLDWNFTAKEFLYWTTQNWANGSVIALSPFAEKIQYQVTNSVVDNVLDSFYDYSLLRVDGNVFPYKNFDLSREDGICTISVKNSSDGFYFAKLNLIQKEHAIIMNNKSMFGDIVYDIETGYRQSRIKLIGFVTGEWNGDFLSPGFIYDEAQISEWNKYTDYNVADVVKYSGKYYSAKQTVNGSSTFDFTKWSLLGSTPVAKLLPNFDYKINQFEDFYSLDVDNFDAGQQKMAQHLTGYTPRTYLTNIFVDPIAQYKFYQGFIKEKGTANAINKLAKASIHNLQGQISFNEEWAFRVGSYGGFNTYNEVEFPLRESDFKENSQIINFVDQIPTISNSVLSYILPTDLSIIPDNYSSSVFDVVSSTYTDNNIILPVAGYVRPDDISATAYNKLSLFDIANTGLIQEGNTVWLGFTDNGDWDVYRYTAQNISVIGSTVTIPATQLTFTTDLYHNLSVGDVISVYGMDNGTDGVYNIVDIPSLTQFSVSSDLTYASASTTKALLFKFISVRVNEFDDIDNLQKSITFKTGDLVWADRGNGEQPQSKWKVYKNINNYSLSKSILNGTINTEQLYGTQIATRESSDILVVSAPSYQTVFGYGKIFVFKGVISNKIHPVSNFGITSVNINSNTVTDFGYSLKYDLDYNLIVAGAPGANLLQVLDINGNYLLELDSIAGGNTRYASSIVLSKDFNYASGKTLVISDPGLGMVYEYNMSANSVGTSTVVTADLVSSISLPTDGVSEYVMDGNSDATRLAVGVPFVDSGQGKVYIYSGPSYSEIQQISPPLGSYNDHFGRSISMSEDGNYLFVSSKVIGIDLYGPGTVFVYKWSSTYYVLIQTIHNPAKGSDLIFGSTIKVDSLTTSLYISSIGRQTYTASIDSGNTTFDGNSTIFIDHIENSGTVHLYERNNIKFILAQEIFDDGTARAGSSYGKSIEITSSKIFVGAPTTLPIEGAVYEFTKLDKNARSWNFYREQDDLIDISKIERAVTVDAESDKVLDYLDIIDPVKGKISGLADQEIRYKTAFDPAIYSIGKQGVVVDTNASWIDDHVGELWWDLSTVKYVWYEQSDLQYRKNYWGKLFPGASIDVYEWVKSEYLPSQWSVLADTNDGLLENISGQPKYPDNSVISVKQYYNSSTGANTNVYFYWVKNTVIIPDVNGRKISANNIANLIFDPARYGIKFISLLANNALSITNIKNELVSNNINLNIAKNSISNDVVNRHTEWILLSEGEETNLPTPMLNKKLIDSLVGFDSLGNMIPDPLLSDRQKYGISIRPRQGMFVNRTEALRNVIEYVNSICSLYLISDIADFTILNSKEEIPDVNLLKYDQLVETYDDLLSIITVEKVPASLTCQISNGSISSVSIVNPGAGYGLLVPVDFDINGLPISWKGPSLEIVNSTGDIGSDLVISTKVNNQGSIISVSIDNPGSRYVSAPIITVRPYTVIVQNDVNSINLWAEYRLVNNKWVKIHTQEFNTTQYWDYVDWKSTNYDPLKPYAAVVSETYQLPSLTLNNGDYVKVNNRGNGKYIILQKVSSNGTFDNDFDLILSQDGTIEFSNNLWNISNSVYNFDYHFTYDQTLYNQTPITELVNILTAIKDNIFIGSLRVYWNYTFFKAVKYAFSEQKFLDWAFKTAFLNIKNLAGSLDQRPVYKFQDSSYYEDYIKEVKPYHSNIRNYQVNYSNIEPTSSYITDFDLPSYYDTATNQLLTVQIGDSLLDVYPWKGWGDNYGLEVESAVVVNPGRGYTSVPSVEIIPAPGDTTGSGATGKVYISLGKVTSVQITNPGSGYTKTPSIVIVGGGSTALVPATVYPRMANNKVRNNSIEMKFDRIFDKRTVSDQRITDNFICDGETFEFELSWAASGKKSDINVVVTNGNNKGSTLLATDYNIVTYKKLVNGYHKLYSNLVLSKTPAIGQIVSITYNKNIGLYTAIDRIQDYYTPTVGMPGNDPSQLMLGIDPPVSQIQGLPFSYTTNWDIKPFGQFLYGDDSDYYTTATVSATALAGTNTLVVNNINGITVGLRVNTVALTTSTLNDNKFGNTLPIVTNIISSSSSIIFNTSTIETINSGTVMLEFWNFNMNPGVLDTVVDGGDLAYTLALGANPSDTIIEGDTFISPYVSYGPEEFVKGEMHESVGISVYTQSNSGSPLVTQSITIIDQTLTNTVVQLPMIPTSTASTMISFNNQVLTYGYDYSIDFKNQTAIINTQTNTGILGVTVVGIGGTGYITSDYITVSNTTTISVHVGEISEIGSIYATLNGQVLSSSQYQLISGKLVVNNISTGTNTLQAWSFTAANNQYSAINEEIFVGDGVTNSYYLNVYPGKTGSPNSQAIVEVDHRRLISPNTIYYLVSGGQTEFLIDPNDNYPPGAFDSEELEVYVNGIKLRNNIDFAVDQQNNLIRFKPGFLKDGDAMAITNYAASDYYFADGYIFIKPSAKYTLNSILKVITFTDGDSSLIRTETFVSRPSKKYVLSRKVLNDRYIWVTAGAHPLVNGVDFYLDDTQQTLILRDSYPYNEGEIISILSISDILIVGNAIGYRAFTDILGRTRFKRMTKNNTTFLAEPLYSTSTTIVVQDGTLLAEPDYRKKIPGSVLIGSEWVEYLNIDGNILSNLRRATLGTGAKTVYPVGTAVIDQSGRQNAPYSETIIKQVITTTNTTSYLVNGILLSNDTVEDQLSVFYAGRLLSKTGIYRQNTDISFDTPPYKLLGTVSTQTALLTATVVGSAYLVTSTNQVWIYSNSKSVNAINGYTYTGLDYIPQEFTLDNVVTSGTTSTAILTLNIPGMITGTHVTILQKVAKNTMYLSTGTSLLDDRSIFAIFLRDQPVAIPDKYYYGQF